LWKKRGMVENVLGITPHCFIVITRNKIRVIKEQLASRLRLPEHAHKKAVDHVILLH